MFLCVFVEVLSSFWAIILIPISYFLIYFINFYVIFKSDFAGCLLIILGITLCGIFINKVPVFVWIFLRMPLFSG